MRRPPHAPFRAGAPRFAPALRPIDPSAWLTPDTEAHVTDWKSSLLDTPEQTLRVTPRAGPAAAEAAQAVEHAVGAPPTGELVRAARRVSDDLVIMQRGQAGWICTALVLTAPTFFSIDAVLGRGLAALHAAAPGGEALARRIARVFDNIRPGQVLERFNWTLQPGSERFTPDAAPLRARAATADPATALDLLHLRVERQTITRLAATGAVLFTTRVCLDPITALAPPDRAALAAAWRALGPVGRAYKGWDALEPLARAAFARWGV